MSMTTELVDLLRECAKKNDITALYGTAKLLRLAADTIEELSAKLHASQMERSSQYYHGGWIPADERLPEEYEDVLVWYEYFRYGRFNRMFETYGIGYHVGGTWGGDVQGHRARCVAWRPLPEPYRNEVNG